jgi:hypothetical protein
VHAGAATAPLCAWYDYLVPRSLRYLPAPIDRRADAVDFINDVLELLKQVTKQQPSARALARIARLGSDKAREVYRGEVLLPPDAFENVIAAVVKSDAATSGALSGLARRYLDNFALPFRAKRIWRNALDRLEQVAGQGTQIQRTVGDSKAAKVDRWIAAARLEHWLPSVQGTAEVPGRFTGRTKVINEIVAWLDGTDESVRIVTGDPGSGKSAVLGWVVLSSDPNHRNEVDFRDAVYPSLPVGWRCAAVHALGRDLSAVVAIVARQCRLPDGDAKDLSAALKSGLAGRVLLVVDALDEAVDVETILTGLIRPLAREPSPWVRVLLGGRRHRPAREEDQGPTG